MADTYGDLFFGLLTDESSPLRGMSVSNSISLGTVLGDFGNWLFFTIGQGLNEILKAFQTFANACYKFLSFGDSPIMKELYDVLARWVWIPIVISALFILFKVFTGEFSRGGGKKYLKNVGMFFLFVAVMPSVFSFMNNNVVNDTYFSSVVGDTGSIGDTILRQNVKDHVFLVNQVLRTETADGTKAENTNLGDLNKHLSELRNSSSNWLTQIFTNENADIQTELNTTSKTTKDALIKEFQDAQKVFVAPISDNDSNLSVKQQIIKTIKFDSETFDYNAKISVTGDSDSSSANDAVSEGDGDTGDSENSESSGESFTNDNIKGIYGFKVYTLDASVASKRSSDNVSEYSRPYVALLMQDGILGTEVGKDVYNRYSIDWLNVWMQLIATSIMFFAIGYSVLKLSMELIIHRIFGTVMAATDLSSGDRMRKYLNSIIGCYAGILISAIVVKIYAEFPNFLESDMGVTNGLVKSIFLFATVPVFLSIPNIITRYFGVNTAASAVGGGIMALAGSSMLRRYDEGRKNRHQARQGRASQRRQNAERKRAAGEKLGNTLSGNFNRSTDNMGKESDKFSEALGDFKDKHGSDGNFEKYTDPKEHGAGQMIDSLGNDKTEAAQQAAMKDFGQEFDNSQNATSMDDIQTPDHDASRRQAAADGAQHISDTTLPDGDKANISDNYKDTVNGVSNAELLDAKYGTTQGIAKQARESVGGGQPNREAYVNAANRVISRTGQERPTSTSTANFASYLGDSAMSSDNHQQLRQNARNIQASSDSRISDSEAYAQAMRQSGMGFSEGNINSIAANEIRDYGSLRDGNIYDSRPNERQFHTSIAFND